MPEDKPSSATGTRLAMSADQRKLIGTAIIEGLITPGAFTFFNPLATEGGDYNQNQGGYVQSGGGNHNQGGGDYNQSAITSRFDPSINVTNLAEVLVSLQRLRR